MIFSEPINGFKVFAERRRNETIVTAVLWSTVLACFFPKILFMSHSLSIVFSRTEPTGQWPWSNCTISEYKYIPSVDTSFSILLKLSFPFENVTC